MPLQGDAINAVLEYLKSKGCAYVLQIANDIGISQSTVVEVLTQLEAQGLVHKSEVLDITKPFSTSKWCINMEKRQSRATVAEEQLGVVVGLIVNPPLINRLNYVPSASLGLMDSLNTIICSATQSLRIMMPYLADLLGIIFINCLDKLRRLSFIRIITEDVKNNKQALEALRQYLPNLEVLYATKYSGGAKVAGVHAKVIIIDESYVIVGTFNLTRAHMLVNYDIGVVIKGNVVKTLVKIFDDVWAYEQQKVIS